VTIHSVYGPDGNRIAEYNEATGALIREYIWLEGAPIAVVEGGVISFVRSDHIGRPVFATNSTGVKVWTAAYLPFGGVRVTTGTPPTARFPGQWFQSETGLHQNWMRDYDPTTGRYLQADPLGLVDGASVYGYALGNPGRYTDPRGEEIRVTTTGGGALGIDRAAHALVYGTECQCQTETGGSSGVRILVSTRPSVYMSQPFTVVSVPAGVSEQDAINNIDRLLNRGLYIPLINDCFGQLDAALRELGYSYPGPPRNRLDFEDYRSAWRQALNFFNPLNYAP
jgi:RHS repeat-associated protein